MMMMRLVMLLLVVVVVVVILQRLQNLPPGPASLTRCLSPAPRCPWLRDSCQSPTPDVLSVLLLAAMLVQGKLDVLTTLLDER